VRGKVQGFSVTPIGRSLAVAYALLSDGTGVLQAAWFRRASFRYDVFASLRKRLVKGVDLLVHGQVELGRQGCHQGCQIRADDYEISPGENGGIVPVYPLTEGVESGWFRELMEQALRDYGPLMAESFPTVFRQHHRLAPLLWSLQNIHFPKSLSDRAIARRRLAFEEFFYLELALARVRRVRSEGPPAPSCVSTRTYLTPFRKGLSFDFTSAQKRVINELFLDMGQSRPMNRLLQGDVGSGKTVVAVAAMLLAVEAGYQAALMAPTEILADQHGLLLERLLKGLPIRRVFLTSGLSKAVRRERLAALKSGEASLAVGTHALLQGDVEFKNLGLAVIDEQHRFGVRQRASLQRKALSPHVLVMTATPIPRTLALTLYGDLSVSSIDQLPPGRTPIVTRWGPESGAMAAVSRVVHEGRQAYVVFPLVEESDVLDLRAAVNEWERLRSQVFSGVEVGLLHGQMKSQDKDRVMARFAGGEIKILVATPVIEVGIDVPNATVIVIMNADRFGLAQLHQLRGRVGRGAHPSECWLVSSTHSMEARNRLRLLCSTQDGFKLAEEDLSMRGPGEFLGESQHGLPTLKIGNLVTDGALIQEARDSAFRLIDEDPCLERPENQSFRTHLQTYFSSRLFFGQVG
jgi:ATP-dependent DNA helicase RecG